MATKSTTTKSGKIIQVTLERGVQDKVSNADGYRMVIGREVIERTTITVKEQSGKVLATGRELETLRPKIFKFHAEMMERGAVAQLGDSYLVQEAVDLINGLLAELEAENPKSNEQLEIERLKAEAHARWEAEWPAIMEAEELNRRMDDPNSDL